MASQILCIKTVKSGVFTEMVPSPLWDLYVLPSYIMLTFIMFCTNQKAVGKTFHFLFPEYQVRSIPNLEQQVNSIICG